MDWLDHNPIADMDGPSFLAFYFALAIAMILLCHWRVQRSDRSRLEQPMRIPASPDPGEIAYLRGGPNEVLRLLVFNLIEMGYVQVDRGGRRRGPHRRHIFTMQAVDGLDTSRLPEHSREIFEWFQQSRQPGEIFQSYLPGRVREWYAPYEEYLRAEQLMLPDDARRRMRAIVIQCNVFLVGAGLYKVLAALSHGIDNVGFLLFMMFGAAFLLPALCKSPRLAQRGRDYIDRLQSAFRGIDRGQQPECASGATVDPMLLTVGVFGFASLDNSIYGQYRSIFAKGTTSSGVGNSRGSCSGAGCGNCTSSVSSCSSSSASTSSCNSSTSSSSCSSSSSGGGCGGCSSSS